MTEQLVPTWMQDAACRGLDPEMFYPERGDVRAVANALAVCATCPVRDPCRVAGLFEPGVWGGTSRRQRRNAGDRNSCRACGAAIPPRFSWCDPCRDERRHRREQARRQDRSA